MTEVVVVGVGVGEPKPVAVRRRVKRVCGGRKRAHPNTDGRTHKVRNP
jgi:hypothetical protein